MSALDDMEQCCDGRDPKGERLLSVFKITIADLKPKVSG